MSFADLLIHTCDIGKLTQGVANEYGTKDKTYPTALYTSEPCRLMSTGGREVKVGAEVVISDWKLFIDTEVDVDEQDRVSNIILVESGIVIDDATFEILLVKPMSDSNDGHHKELLLRKVA